MRTYASPTPTEHAVNMAAPLVPAAAAAWASAKLAPLFELSVVPALALAGGLVFAAGYGLMKISGRRETSFRVPQMGGVLKEADRDYLQGKAIVEDELLLDVPLMFEELPEEQDAQDDPATWQDVRMAFAAKAVPAYEDALELEERWSPEGDDAEICSVPVAQDQVEQRVEQLSELILDDPLITPSADSRVVRLFAPQPLPTAGQMADNIARHIESRDGPMPLPDASDALDDALNNLRRTLSGA